MMMKVVETFECDPPISFEFVDEMTHWWAKMFDKQILSYLSDLERKRLEEGGSERAL